MTDPRSAAFYAAPTKKQRRRKALDFCAARGPGGAMCYKNRGHEETAGHSDGEVTWGNSQ